MLKTPSTISKIVTLADNTVRLQVDCQELAPESEAEIFQLRNKLGYFIFAVQEQITETDIPTETIEFRTDKTPSQRLRAVFYKQWEELAPVAGKKKVDWDTYYRVKMERLITQEKEKLH